MRDFNELLASVTIAFSTDYIRQKAKGAGINCPASFKVHLREQGYTLSRGKWMLNAKVPCNLSYGSRR